MDEKTRERTLRLIETCGDPKKLRQFAKNAHFAGAREVAISLWDVSDSGTDALMHEFVDALAKSSKANSMPAGGAEYALAVAMRTSKEKLKDPALWAAFTVYGTPSTQ